MMKISYEHYMSFYKSGMFWEWFPECIGEYEHDEPIISKWIMDRAKPVPDCEYQLEAYSCANSPSSTCKEYCGNEVSCFKTN